MELKQQQRRFTQRQLAVGVAGLDRVGVHQLNTRDRHTHLNRLDHALDSRLNRWKVAYCRRDCLGLRIQLDRDFRDDAQRPLTAHKQPRQIVSGR